MKMRNLLRSIPFLLLMVSGLSLFLNCKCPVSHSTAPANYTVTFDAQGGSSVDSVKVEHGKTITKPTDPVKVSFIFGGWYKESACTMPWNFATDTVTAPITLYAKWTTETVTADITLFAKWQTTSPTSITIRFDSSKMRCFKNVAWNTISASSMVNENDMLSFNATNLT